MEQDFKFRAFDTAKKRMFVTGFHIVGECTMFQAIEAHCEETKGVSNFLQRMNEIIITEWTGLVDKNGQDIYEGDIIRKSTGYLFEMKKQKYQIGKGNFVYGYEFDPLNEVIGNIFESPETLNYSKAS